MALAVGGCVCGQVDSAFAGAMYEFNNPSSNNTITFDENGNLSSSNNTPRIQESNNSGFKNQIEIGNALSTDASNNTLTVNGGEYRRIGITSIGTVNNNTIIPGTANNNTITVNNSTVEGAINIASGSNPTGNTINLNNVTTSTVSINGNRSEIVGNNLQIQLYVPEFKETQVFQPETPLY